MSYYVSIGGITLYGVTEVEETSGREMQEYDGIGSGKFPVPESRDLHTWVISCHLTEKNDYNLPHWQPASEIFRLFEVLLNTKDPSNFILTSKGDYTATSGYLESYVKNEKFIGVFEVSVKIRENRVVGVKTTDVPYVARPGKKPVPPKVTVKKGGNAYDSTRNTTGDDPPAPKRLTTSDFRHKEKIQSYFSDPLTTKPIFNPALVEEGDIYVSPTLTDYFPVNDMVDYYNENTNEKIWGGIDKIKNNVAETFQWMGDKINDFKDWYNKLST